jgi:hypothetical protein
MGDDEPERQDYADNDLPPPRKAPSTDFFLWLILLGAVFTGCGFGLWSIMDTLRKLPDL